MPTLSGLLENPPSQMLDLLVRERHISPRQRHLSPENSCHVRIIQHDPAFFRNITYILGKCPLYQYYYKIHLLCQMLDLFVLRAPHILSIASSVFRELCHVKTIQHVPAFFRNIPSILGKCRRYQIY